MWYVNRWAFALLCALFAFSCTSSKVTPNGKDSDSGSSTDPILNFSIETASDGSGDAISNIELEVGDSLQVFAVQRDVDGGYVAPVEVSWVLAGTMGDLNILSGGQTAVFSASQAGSGTVKASYENKTKTISITINPATDAVLSLSPSASDSMDITGGSSPGSAVVFTLENIGSLPSSNLLAPVLGGDDLSHFELVAGQDNCSGNTLAVGATCTFQVRPLASNNLSYEATLSISDGAKTSNVANLSGAASGFAASLALSPSSITGMNISGASSPGSASTLTLTNNGNLTSGTLLAPSLSGANTSNFEILNDDCVGNTLAPAASCTFEVRPVASADGAYSASLSVGDGSVTSGSSSLSGSASGFAAASLSLSASSTSGINITAGTSPSSVVTVTLENTGGATSGVLQSPSFSGSGMDNFQLVPGEDNCTGTSLTASASCTFEIQAMASANASYTASLVVGDGSLSSNSLSLSGSAAGFDPGDTIIFATSSMHNGNLGGLSGADNICSNLAGAANLAAGYKALLSDSATSAKDRYSIHGIVKMTSGVKVADDASDLWDGSLDNGINLDESEQTLLSLRTWTGSTVGGIRKEQHCSNWSSTSSLGGAGATADDDSDWMAKDNRDCDESYRLFCVGPENGALSLTGQAGGASGNTSMTIKLPGDISTYSKVVLRRSTGSTAPLSHCEGASDTVVHTDLGAFTSNGTIPVTDNVGTPSTAVSYRVCVYDSLDSLLVSAKLESVTTAP